MSARERRLPWFSSGSRDDWGQQQTAAEVFALADQEPTPRELMLLALLHRQEAQLVAMDAELERRERVTLAECSDEAFEAEWRKRRALQRRVDPPPWHSPVYSVEESTFAGTHQLGGSSIPAHPHIRQRGAYPLTQAEVLTITADASTPADAQRMMEDFVRLHPELGPGA